MSKESNSSKVYPSSVTIYLSLSLYDKQKTIKQTWSYGKQLGKKNFTVVIGFAQKLANGNVLLDFGYKNNGKESNIIEVNSQGQQVWNATVKNASIKAYVYRAYRLEFYPTSYVFDVNQ
ncbi:aryl-sulfate sulfotransferase [Liquorilactobacillus nagelii]|nr:aryl-sulfate sulfotransferase [Liquorilactobacillus nagelii]